jgi:hypothetical protein
VKGSGTNIAPSPALGDISGDGIPDVVFAGTDGILTVRDRDGQPVAPVHGVRYSVLNNGASSCSPVIADLDGDGRNDILVGDEMGSLTAVSGATGTVLPGFPITLESEARGAPAVCDCDLDGMTEIIATSSSGTVYMWDYDRPFSPGQIAPWPQFHHDAARTGLLSHPVSTGTEERERVPGAIELSPALPNPATRRMQLHYGVPAELDGARLELAVYDLSGRLVRVLERGTARAGRHSVQWNLRGGSGARVEGGVYFVRMSLGRERRIQKLVVVR